MFGSDRFTSLSSRTSQISELATENTSNTDKKKKTDQKEGSLISRLLSGDRDAKDAIVQSTINAMQQNDKTNEKLNKQIQGELDHMFGSRESTDDVVQLSAEKFYQESDETISLQKKEEKKQLEETIESKHDEETDRKEFVSKGKDGNIQTKTLEQMKKLNQNKITDPSVSKSPQEEAVKKAVKEYSSSLCDYLINKSPQQKQKMDEVKKQLQEHGFSTTSLVKMETSVNNMVRQHLVATMKDKMLKYLMSKSDSKASLQLAGEELLSFYNSEIEGNEALGGKNFGNFKGGAMSAFEETRATLQKDISGFILDEAEESFVNNTINQKSTKDFNAQMQKLQKFCVDADIQINNSALIQRIQKSIDHLGLACFFVPDNANHSFSFQEGDERGKKKDQEESMVYLTDEEQLIDKLRGLYFQKAMNPGLKTLFELTFKIRKTKNNLLKMGVLDKSSDSQLESEAHFLAKEKLLAELQKVFLEQATLHKLEGPSYDILRNRKAFILKSLHKIGYKIKDTEVNRIRDKANREMFPIIKEQLAKVEIMADIRETIQVVRQRKMLTETLQRIKDESNIQDMIEIQGETSSKFVERNIIEAA